MIKVHKEIRHHSVVLILNFEQVSNLVLMFLNTLWHILNFTIFIRNRTVLLYRALIAASPVGTVLKQRNILNSSFQIQICKMDLTCIYIIFLVALPEKHFLCSVLRSLISRWNSPYSSLRRNVGQTQCFRLRFCCKANQFLHLFNNKSTVNLPSISSPVTFLW